MEEEEEEEEDFSFPTTAASAGSSSPATGLDSPPLWRLSPIHPQSPPPPPPIHRRSFSHAAEYYTKPHRQNPDHHGGKMIKMDMLWEDFNDELSTSTTTIRSRPRVYPVHGRGGLLLSPPRGNLLDREIGYNSATKRGGGGVDVGCGEAGRLMRLSPKRRGVVGSTTTAVRSPAGGGGESTGSNPARMVTSSGGGKPGLVVLVKVLKRLFLLHHHRTGGRRRR